MPQLYIKEVTLINEVLLMGYVRALSLRKANKRFPFLDVPFCCRCHHCLGLKSGLGPWHVIKLPLY